MVLKRNRSTSIVKISHTLMWIKCDQSDKWKCFPKYLQTCFLKYVNTILS